jgi:hypothetical protein
MNTRGVPSPRGALADVPDFQQARGHGYELLPVLLLRCVAVMCGARSRVRAGHVPRVMATLRNIAVSLLRVSGAANITSACRRYATRLALAPAAVGVQSLRKNKP